MHQVPETPKLNDDFSINVKMPPTPNPGPSLDEEKENDDERLREKIGRIWRKNPEQEIILQGFGEKAAAMQWLHMTSAQHHRTINARFIYLTLLLNTVAGVGGFGGASLVSGSVAVAIAYVTGAINITNALLTAFMRGMQSAEKAEAHIRRSVGYAALYRVISLELGLSPEHRTEMHSFSNRCRTDFDRLQLNTPPIPRKIVKEFNEIYPNQRNKPDVAVGVATIKIHRDGDHRKLSIMETPASPRKYELKE
jgi:hypothetical protein